MKSFHIKLLLPCQFTENIPLPLRLPVSDHYHLSALKVWTSDNVFDAISCLFRCNQFDYICLQWANFQVYSLIMKCGNIVPLMIRFLEVAKFPTVTQLSL